MADLIRKNDTALMLHWRWRTTGFWNFSNIKCIHKYVIAPRTEERTKCKGPYSAQKGPGVK
jgi:hypothetical protein